MSFSRAGGGGEILFRARVSRFLFLGFINDDTPSSIQSLSYLRGAFNQDWLCEGRVPSHSILVRAVGGGGLI